MIRKLLDRLFNPGRSLAQIGHEQYRRKVRARVDEMREKMGLEPARWPE